MANPEHVEIVKGGATAIAKWRRQHPDERMDLSEAHLRRAYLTEADLSGADLRGADLRQADLRKAHVTLADISWADLSEADLSEAGLGAADLVGTRLSGADLREARLLTAVIRGGDLSRANLSGSDLDMVVLCEADLRGTDLSDAHCSSTVFADCDLSQVRGLESVAHVMPSSIGIDTLVRTLQGAGGQFTAEQRTFFENAGVPKTLLDFLPGLLESHPIQFFSCFISYGSDDEQFADRLYGDLKERGVTCWKYNEDGLIGRGVRANVDQALRLHDKTILVCSESALQRPWVLREIERALQREDELKIRRSAEPDTKIDTDVLFPVRLDDYVLKGWEHPAKADVVAKNIGDFRDWDKDEKNYKRGLEQLLRALDPRSKLGLSKGDLRELGQD